MTGLAQTLPSPGLSPCANYNMRPSLRRWVLYCFPHHHHSAGCCLCRWLELEHRFRLDQLKTKALAFIQQQLHTGHTRIAVSNEPVSAGSRQGALIMRGHKSANLLCCWLCRATAIAYSASPMLPQSLRETIPRSRKLSRFRCIP